MKENGHHRGKYIVEEITPLPESNRVFTGTLRFDPNAETEPFDDEVAILLYRNAPSQLVREEFEQIIAQKNNHSEQ